MYSFANVIFSFIFPQNFPTTHVGTILKGYFIIWIDMGMLKSYEEYRKMFYNGKLVPTGDCPELF